jgi:hypothetical protein
MLDRLLGTVGPTATIGDSLFLHTLVCSHQTTWHNNNLDWGPVPHFCPLEALQPMWLTPEVYCTIPVFLIVPTLAARCLSCPQPAVVP